MVHWNDETADTWTRCDNCDSRWPKDQLAPADDLEGRLDPGSEVPAGECPECGALAYLVVSPLKRLLAEAEQLLGALAEWNQTTGGGEAPCWRQIARVRALLRRHLGE